MNRLALVVDDEPLVRQTIVRIPTTAGFESLEASNARDALRVAADVHPQLDIVVSDIKMPGGDGLELARALNELYPKLPVVLVSAYPDLEGLSVNAVFLQKPFTSAQLNGLVEQLCPHGA